MESFFLAISILLIYLNFAFNADKVFWNNNNNKQIMKICFFTLGHIFVIVSMIILFLSI